MDLVTVIIRWEGPFSFDDVCRSEARCGIYLLTGKRKYERHEQIQYCGITEGLFCNRINSRHTKLSLIREETLGIWLGQITYPLTHERNHLERAESCFVSFWQPELNEKKRAYYPALSICFISHWFTRAGKPRKNRPAIIRDLPDVLWWDQENWRIGNLRVLEN